MQAEMNRDIISAPCLNQNVQLRLNALNLTDALYYDGVSGGHVVPGAGRTFILSGNFRY